MPWAGASSRNAGFLMRGCADHYADACARYGRERARGLWRLSEENLAALIREGAERLPSFRRVPSCLMAMDGEQERELRRSGEMLREDGLVAPWITSGDDSAWASGCGVGGLVNPHDASVNPFELMTMLAGKLRRPIHEGAEVWAIEQAAGGRVAVRTAMHEFVAPRVMVCTNAYGPLLLPELETLITPRRGQMVAMRYPAERGVRLAYSYYFNHGSEYFRQTPDGTVVFGGCRTYHADEEVGYEDRVTRPVQTDIEGWARKLLGDGYEVTARWAGTMGFSRDGLPIVGPVPGFATSGGSQLWFCGGFTGHGMSMGYVTAQGAVAAMVDGAENLFDIARF